ncbi:type II secretion system protein J [Chloroflexota bacterium]
MDRQKGFTLIELTVMLAISSVMLLLVMQIYINLNLDYARNTNRLITNADLNRAIISLQKDVIQSQEIIITANLTTLKWTDYTGNQTDHVVTYGFNGTGSTVLQRIYDGALEIVGRDITEFVFTSDNNTTNVRITSAGNPPWLPSKTIEMNIKNRGEFEVEE